MVLKLVETALVYPETFAEWLQTHNWHRILICINPVYTTHPTMVTP